MPMNRKAIRWAAVGLTGLGILVAAVVYFGVDYVMDRRVVGQFFEAEAGVRLHYTDEGSGEPVILIHGLAAQSDLNWRVPGITKRLARGIPGDRVGLPGSWLEQQAA